jgi:hypothetical protein
MDTAAPDVEADGGGCFVAMDSCGETGGGSTEGAGEAVQSLLSAQWGRSREGTGNWGFSVWEPNSLRCGRLPEDAGDLEPAAACVGLPTPQRRLWERGATGCAADFFGFFI